jgi:MoxR-like ATPase
MRQLTGVLGVSKTLLGKHLKKRTERNVPWLAPYKWFRKILARGLKNIEE